VLVPHLTEDVHAIDGLADINEHLFGPAEGFEAAGA